MKSSEQCSQYLSSWQGERLITLLTLSGIFVFRPAHVLKERERRDDTLSCVKRQFGFPGGAEEQSSRGPWQCVLREFISVWLPKSCWTGLINRLIMTKGEYPRCSPWVVERAKGSAFAPPISAIVHDFTWSQLWLQCFLYVGTTVHAYSQWSASRTL